MPVLGEQMLIDELMRIPGLHLFPDEPLARHTRFALGGPARLLVDATSPTSLSSTLLTLRTSRHPFLLIGGGTNLIVAEQGFDGIAVRYRANHINREDAALVITAGADLEAAVDFSTGNGLAGMECLKRIPGWLGAAVYGNAGAYGQQISDHLTSVTFHDGDEIRKWTKDSCAFRYRWSGFKQHKNWVILEAAFALPKGDSQALQARAEEIRTIRDEKFPPSLRCAGSIFKNFILSELPEATQARVPASMVKGGKVPAAWFLEHVGAKGLAQGGIHIADYHANLIYNDGHGRTSELISLIDDLKRRISNEFTIALEEEVQYVGFDDRVSH
jgi:UDP-N-acetylmuramate dehydrogenase